MTGNVLGKSCRWLCAPELATNARQIQINTPPQADKEAEGHEEYSEPLVWASSLRMIKVINEFSAHEEKHKSK